jgi:O-antigen/teichoic acid export membrane protein
MEEDLKTTISRNIMILVMTRVVTWSSSFILMLYLPRYLGPVEYGRFYLGFSITAMFGLLIEFGGNYSITKSVSRNQADVGHILVDSIAVRVVLWVIAFAGVLLYGYFSPHPASVRTILAIFGIAMLWNGARAVLWSGYRGFEMLKYPSYGAMAETVLIAALGFVAVILGGGSVGFAVITSFGTLINFLICARYISRITTGLPAINWRAAFDSLKDGVPYFLNSIFGYVYYRIDTVMLSYMSPESVVGWYGASYKFFDTLMFIPSTIVIAVFPAFARRWGEGRDSLTKPLQKSLDFILLAGIPVSAYTFFYSREIVSLFYGLEGYYHSVILLQMFSLGLLLVYIDMMLGTVLLASDRQKQLTRFSFMAIFVNIGLNFVLIPYSQTTYGNGGLGASLATLITELFIMATMLYAMPEEIMATTSIRVQLKILGAGILLVVSLLALSMVGLPLSAQVGISFGVYAFVIFYTKVIETEEIRFLRSVLKPLDFWRSS